MMLVAVKMMAIAYVMMDGWAHIAMTFVQKGMLMNLFVFHSGSFFIKCIFSRNFYLLRFYGKHCMEECSCPSPQFVCQAAHGCVCKSGFIGIDCLTPRSQELKGMCGILF